MPLPQRPIKGLRDPNQETRDRETLSKILSHQFDDSRVRTKAEVLAGVTPVNYAYPPGAFKRNGAAGDDSTDDTATISRAFNSGETDVIAQPGTYVSGTVNAGSGVRQFTGTGTLKQAAENSDLLKFDGNENLKVDGIKFQSASALDNDFAVSGNTALTIKNARGVVVSNCSFNRFLYHGLYLENCDDVIVSGNYFYECAIPLRIRGCRRVTIVGNVFNKTCLNEGEFTVALGLDSTDGHALGICEEVSIVGNTFTDLGDAQGVLVHAGNLVTVQGNTFKNVATPISGNPFNATDVISRLSIVGNVMEGASSGTYTNTDIGITVQGGGTTPDPAEIVISGNIINSANRVMQDPDMCAIRVGFTRGVSITSNVITTAYANGIILTDSEEQVVISGNTINDIIDVSGRQTGIHIETAGAKVIIDGNHISDIAGAGGIGIDVGGTGQVIIRDNLFRNCTENLNNPSNASYGNVRSVTSGTTVDLGGIDTVEFAHGSATTVTTFANVLPHKIYTFYFTNGNTTIDRTSCFLDGGANKTGTANDVMLMMGIASNQLAQAAPISSNS